MLTEINKYRPGSKELLKFIADNEKELIAFKKMELKKSDSIHYSDLFVDQSGRLASKAMNGEALPSGNVPIKAVNVINTTNWFDSHYDVHIPKLWNDSLKKNKKTGFYLLKQHDKSFESIIAEGSKAYVKKMTWKELGFDYEGETEALMFESLIEPGRNPYMYDQYKKGYVKQHSVGMRYVRFITCINDDEYPVQKENWDKYIELVANRDAAEAAGFFWAVLEAQVVEGSAVVFGSNCMTPNYSTEEVTEDSTKSEPAGATCEKSRFEEVIKEYKFI